MTFIIADNQDITHAGICHYINNMFDECQIIDAHNKSEIIFFLKKDKEALTILDYDLFDFNSIDEFISLVSQFPLARWILFSNYLNEELVHRLGIKNNINMILKDNSSDEIHIAIRCMVRGEHFLCHQITNLLLENKKGEKKQLTPTELEILKLLTNGKSVKEIATIRFASIHTITSHKKNIFRKLGVNTTYEAIKYAMRTGIADMTEYYI